jgi:hypothetical protein
MQAWENLHPISWLNILTALLWIWLRFRGIYGLYRERERNSTAWSERPPEDFGQDQRVIFQGYENLAADEYFRYNRLAGSTRLRPQIKLGTASQYPDRFKSRNWRGLAKGQLIEEKARKCKSPPRNPETSGLHPSIASDRLPAHGLRFIEAAEKVVQDQFLGPMGRAQEAIGVHVNKARRQFLQR